MEVVVVGFFVVVVVRFKVTVVVVGFTVVVDLGQKEETGTPPGEPSATDLASEFFRMTKKEGLTRRQAISAIARTHGLSSRRIFDLLEQAKGSPV